MAKFHKIPVLRFEDQELTSFSGLLVFQQLFQRIQLKQRLKACFAHLNLSPIFGRHLVILLLIVHLLLGFRRLRELDYYRDDPIVLRLMGLRRLPDVATISRALMQIDADGVEQVRRLSRNMVLEGLQREQFPRLTFDFDGSVQSTTGHAEGTAVGFNKKKEGRPQLLRLVLHGGTNRAIFRPVASAGKCARFQWGSRIHAGLFYRSPGGAETHDL